MSEQPTLEEFQTKADCVECGKEFIVSIHTTTCPHCGKIYEDGLLYKYVHDRYVARYENGFTKAGNALTSTGKNMQVAGRGMSSFGCGIFIIGFFIILILFLLFG